MARGDPVTNVTANVANGSSLTIQPASGTSWTIQNIYFSATCQLILVNGSNNIIFANFSGNGVNARAQYHVTNTQYIQIKNTSGGTGNFGYDGVDTSVPSGVAFDSPVQNMVSVANGSTTDIRPASGAAWLIHNIYYGGNLTLYYTDGTNLISVASATYSASGNNIIANQAFLVSNSYFLRISNTGSSTAVYAWDGVEIQ